MLVPVNLRRDSSSSCLGGRGGRVGATHIKGKVIENYAEVSSPLLGPVSRGVPSHSTWKGAGRALLFQPGASSSEKRSERGLNQVYSLNRTCCLMVGKLLHGLGTDSLNIPDNEGYGW
ncbi:hypothetical protein KIL84_010051 [Mauremys mutica]|uniref:Uncharacterized protein n=1 Tax=Mauremys mutica TaxID=74926 RepID=A0A9D3XMA0_9SAUR|nr:hypothetical protein KIL84_010051 [Mauremys mutica]